jgi:hypothetical protein
MVPRVWLGLAGGLAVIGLLLALPAPHRPAVGVTASASPSPTGPPALASVWPRARPFTIPATLPDGGTYTPTVLVDASTSIGTVTSADGQRTDLAVVPATGPQRVLQSQSVNDGGSFDGVTVTADRVYWMHTLSDSNGRAHVTLWRAALSGGPAAQVTADTGAPVFYGSRYDVQQVGDRLYWAAARPDRPDQTELRSVALTGGAVAVRVLDGAWSLSAWPWLVTAPGATGTPMRLRNLETGAVTPVNVPASKQASCSPTWCRIVPDSGGTETDLLRPDGSDRRVIGDSGAAAIDSDVALLDRFEVLMSIISSSGQITVSRLALYDIRTKRSVVVDNAASNAGGRGDFIWWATGDNETLAWHGLDLRELA